MYVYIVFITLAGSTVVYIIIVSFALKSTSWLWCCRRRRSL